MAFAAAGAADALVPACEFPGFAGRAGRRAGDVVTVAGVQQGTCPATFRAEYLRAGERPHCIDFILTADGVKAEGAGVVFTGKEPLPGGPGYVSDHVGLRASLFLASS